MSLRRTSHRSTYRSAARPPAPDTTISVPNHPTRREQRVTTWFNLALGALIPLAIGIGTVVITIRQQQTDERGQDQDRELDDRRYQLEQAQADELHYQDVFKTYIQDVSSALYKQQANHFSAFVDNRTRVAYIRSQTLTALQDLDPVRRTRLFYFLHENELLSETISLDLSRANLSAITVGRSSEFPSYSDLYKYDFYTLSLAKADLTNASFVSCRIHGQNDFTEATLVNIKFHHSSLGCTPDGYLEFADTHMTGSYFSAGTNICNGFFLAAHMADSTFSGVVFSVQTLFLSVNLVNSDFRGIYVEGG
jgi:uncharacterized protein YjbI with pentapeptide repeats